MKQNGFIPLEVNKEENHMPSLTNEKHIEALIEKGGSVTKGNRKTVEPSGKEVHPVLLNVPTPLLGDIDEELKLLPHFYRKHRTAYILQAIEEKFECDRKKRK